MFDHYDRNKRLAHSDFKRIMRRALKKMGGKPAYLLALAEVLRLVGVRGQLYRGIRAVPVESIVGSVDRAQDFDADFNPVQNRTRARWERINAATRSDETLPPVNLYKVGEFYFVSDGNHRVSVAKALGISYIDAEVIEYMPAKTPEASDGAQLYGWVRSHLQAEAGPACEGDPIFVSPSASPAVREAPALNIRDLLVLQPKAQAACAAG